MDTAEKLTHYIGKIGEYDVFTYLESHSRIPLVYKAVKEMNGTARIVIHIESSKEYIKWIYQLISKEVCGVRVTEGIEFYRRKLEKEIKAYNHLSYLLTGMEISTKEREDLEIIETSLFFYTDPKITLEDHFNFALEFYERFLMSFYENLFIQKF